MKVNFASSGISKKNKFDLSSFHGTTLDFGRTAVTQYIEAVPGDKFDVDFYQKFLMSPLVVPTFGNCRFLTRAFWVPYRVLTPAWENFISEQKDTSVAKTLGSFTNNQFVKELVSKITPPNPNYSAPSSQSVGWSNPYVVKLDSSVAACDIKLSYKDSSGTISYHKYNLTDKGAWLMQIMHGLGYSINWVLSDYFSGGVNVDGDFTQFDWIPLLAFARCMYDYLYPSAYVSMQSFGYLFEGLSTSTFTGIFTDIVRLLYCPYEQDHYNSAWQSFNSVVRNSIVYNDLNSVGATAGRDNSGMQVQANDNGVPIQQNANTQVTTLSAYSLRILQSVSDMLLRYNLAGSRFVERMAARFGFKTNEMRVNQSRFIKSFVIDSNFDEVTNLSPSDGSVLGELAGKGRNVGNGKLSFEAGEFGALVFITQIIPSIGYYQGRGDWTLARIPSEFYTGALDNIGMSPLRNDELFADYQGDSDNTFNDFINHGGLPDGIFGFQPIYSHYKHGRDYLTGDFRRGSRNVGLESYHTLRIIPQPSSDTPFALNSEFLQVKPYDYDRIFAVGQPSRFVGSSWVNYSGNNSVLVDSTSRAICLYDSSHNLVFIVKGDISGDINVKIVGSTNYSTLESYSLSHGYVVVGTLSSYTSGSDCTFVIGETVYTLSSAVLSPSDLNTRVFEPLFSENNYDHFIGYFLFKVTAYRNMLSYSEALPMFNKSGREITTSYEGTQL